MILDENGGLVWFKALSPAGARAADLRVQQYEGKPVLTWWQDPLIAGGSHTAGDVIANSSYQNDRDRARRQRLPARPARVPDHPAGRRR